MNIKDYIHYYLGQPCYDAQGRRAVLIGLNLHAIECPYKVCYGNTEQPSSGIKPLLRRISSMSDSDLLHLASIYSGADRIARENGVASNWFYFHCGFKKSNGGEVVERLVISENGEAWYEHYFDGKRKGANGRNVIRQAEAFHYLLSLGIDLFGLLDAGLAVDAETIKTGSNA